MNGPIRIVVADDHPIVRAGIVGLLESEPGIEVVGEAADGAEAVAVAEAESPDLVLMASGYLLKAAPQAEILAGIRAVAAGETVLAPSIAAKLVSRVRAGASGAPQQLSPRELEVLRLVAAGRSNPDIARSLFIGEATVKTHLLHVFEKLEVNDRTRAVTRAMELGLI